MRGRKKNPKIQEKWHDCLEKVLLNYKMLLSIANSISEELVKPKKEKNKANGKGMNVPKEPIFRTIFH